MKKEIIIDSDVLAAFLQGKGDMKIRFPQLIQEYTLFVTPVTVSEIMSWMRANDEALIDRLFEMLHVLSIDKEIAKRAGLFMQNEKATLRTAMTAACSLHYRFLLWTDHQNNYPMLQKENFFILHTSKKTKGK